MPPVQTMAIDAGSQAIDKGEPGRCSANDQRGAERYDGNGDSTVTCDIGAYEFGWFGFTFGDLNCDGRIDGTDAVYPLLLLVDIFNPPPVQCPLPDDILNGGGIWADFNCNGGLNEDDITAFLKVPAGFPSDPDDDCPDIGTTVLVSLG